MPSFFITHFYFIFINGEKSVLNRLNNFYGYNNNKITGTLVAYSGYEIVNNDMSSYNVTFNKCFIEHYITIFEKVVLWRYCDNLGVMTIYYTFI